MKFSTDMFIVFAERSLSLLPAHHQILWDQGIFHIHPRCPAISIQKDVPSHHDRAHSAALSERLLLIVSLMYTLALASCLLITDAK